MKLLFRVVLALVAVAVLTLWLAAREDLLPEAYNPLTPLDPEATPNIVTSFKLWRMEEDLPACLAALKASSAVFRIVPLHTESFEPGCELADTVMLSRLSEASIKPEEMRCDIALRLYLHERHDLQPLARKHFGTGISRIHHFGSYSCRTMRGSSRMSEHATANAFDIAGFSLRNGRDVSLLKGWKAGGATSAFLREARIRACLLFNMVLSPDYNADHADHFHVDMGPFMGCN